MLPRLSTPRSSRPEVGAALPAHGQLPYSAIVLALALNSELDLWKTPLAGWEALPSESVMRIDPFLRESRLEVTGSPR